MGWDLEALRSRMPQSLRLEECTPPNVHLCQIRLIGRLDDQLVHLSIDRKSNGLLRHKAPKLVANILQNSGRRVGHGYLGAALWEGSRD